MNRMDDFEWLFDRQTLAGGLTALAVMATILTAILPRLSRDNLAVRMKSVANERERIKQRERAALQAESSKALRFETKVYMKDVVDRFSLGNWLNAEGIRARLAMAGYRGPQAEVGFLFARLVAPIGFIVAAIVGLYTLADPDMETLTKIGVVVAAMFLGVKAPEWYIKNIIIKRQGEMARAFPDGLDLMLICVESGMSIEHAFRKVSQEMGSQSPALAEEFALTMAELSYLPDRRAAYANLAARTGLEPIKHFGSVLVQAEKYGTAIGRALRVASQESREARMTAAERKPAALPPKLTVPMILFFLPVLIAVVIGPAGIQVAQMM
jgi:tight adherence protein C